jgi:hypothetical protein
MPLPLFSNGLTEPLHKVLKSQVRVFFSMLDKDYAHIIELPKDYPDIDKICWCLNRSSAEYKYMNYCFRFRNRDHACALLSTITYHSGASP